MICQKKRGLNPKKQTKTTFLWTTAGEAGTHTHQPEAPETADHRPPDQDGTPTGENSNTRRPKPTANAAEPQEPEPAPRNERPGRTPEGQAPEGATTNRPREPAATDRTQAAERRAKAATKPPLEKRGDEAENTSNPGEPEKNDRTTASTPRAHPTETRQPDEGTKGRTEATAAAADGQEREPENPTEDTPAKKEARGEENGENTTTTNQQLQL